MKHEVITSQAHADRHRAMIEATRPGDTEDEKHVRTRLLVARDIAQSHLGKWLRFEGPIRDQYRSIVEIAGQYAFASASIDELRNARAACLLMLQAASALEGLEAERTQ